MRRNPAEIRPGHADAIRPRPAQLMPPHLAPACRRRPTFHDHRTNLDAIAEPRDAVAELEIVRQTIRQRAEAADLGELLAPRRHHRTEGEVQFPKARAL